MRQIINLVNGIGQKIPMKNGNMEKSIASLTFNPRDNEIVWATPGTIVVDGCNMGKMSI